MSAETHKTLRHWAFAAGFIDSELDAAAERMHNAIRDEVLREAAEKIRASTQDARKVERDRFKFTDFESQLQYEAAMAAADLIDPDKEN